MNSSGAPHGMTQEGKFLETKVINNPPDVDDQIPVIKHGTQWRMRGKTMTRCVQGNIMKHVGEERSKWSERIAIISKAVET